MKPEPTDEVPASALPTIQIPLEGHTGATLRNLLNMIHSKQGLLKRVFDFNYNLVSSDFINSINDLEIKEIEDFKRAIAIVAEDHITGIEFDFEHAVLGFSFLNDQPPERIEACTQFLIHLDTMARKLKHASFKETVTDNDKFTMRTWLIRLGFVGTEHKQVRKMLLLNLEGNGAFRKGKAQEAIV